MQHKVFSLLLTLEVGPSLYKAKEGGECVIHNIHCIFSLRLENSVCASLNCKVLRLFCQLCQWISSKEGHIFGES